MKSGKGFDWMAKKLTDAEAENTRLTAELEQAQAAAAVMQEWVDGLLASAPDSLRQFLLAGYRDPPRGFNSGKWLLVELEELRYYAKHRPGDAGCTCSDCAATWYSEIAVAQAAAAELLECLQGIALQPLYDRDRNVYGFECYGCGNRSGKDVTKVKHDSDCRIARVLANPGQAMLDERDKLAQEKRDFKAGFASARAGQPNDPPFYAIGNDEDWSLGWCAGNWRAMEAERDEWKLKAQAADREHDDAMSKIFDAVSCDGDELADALDAITAILAERDRLLEQVEGLVLGMEASGRAYTRQTQELQAENVRLRKAIGNFLQWENEVDRQRFATSEEWFEQTEALAAALAGGAT